MRSPKLRLRGLRVFESRTASSTLTNGKARRSSTVLHVPSSSEPKSTLPGDVRCFLTSDELFTDRICPTCPNAIRRHYFLTSCLLGAAGVSADTRSVACTLRHSDRPWRCLEVWMHRQRVAVLTGLLIAALVACGGGAGAHKVKRHAAATTTTAPRPPVAPLTGLPDPDGQSLGRPALSTKIENTPEARPQDGLDVADVVFEEITEGDITRFVAVFNSTIPDVVGPLRSVRAMDPDLVEPLGGIFAYSGGIPETVDLISHAPGVNAVDESQAGPAMFRDKTKLAPHNLFGHGQNLVDQGGQPVPVHPLFSYLDAGEVFNGDPVAQFTVGFKQGYAVSYTFDPASHTWQRFLGLLAPSTAASGQQIAPTNVIVEFVGCCVPSPEGGAYQTVGQGDAWVFSDGKLARGQWARADGTQPTQYVNATGAPIKLSPGRTWVEYVPAGLEYPVDVTAPPPSPPPAT